MLYLFDIDGTLIHCHGAGRRAFERACQDLLGAGCLTDIRLDGKTDPGILSEAFLARLRRAPSAAEARRIELAYEAHLREETAPAGAVKKLPFVDELLDALSGRGAVLGLATGNWRRGAAVKLGRVGLFQRFLLGGFGCDAADRGELVRAGLRRGEEHLGRPLPREEVVVIGDTPRDIAAAHAACAYAVGVATGAYSAAELQAAGADRVIPDLSALL